MPKWVDIFIKHSKNQYEHHCKKDFKEKYIYLKKIDIENLCNNQNYYQSTAKRFSLQSLLISMVLFNRIYYVFKHA